MGKSITLIVALETQLSCGVWGKPNEIKGATTIGKNENFLFKCSFEPIHQLHAEM